VQKVALAAGVSVLTFVAGIVAGIYLTRSKLDSRVSALSPDVDSTLTTQSMRASVVGAQPDDYKGVPLSIQTEVAPAISPPSSDEDRRLASRRRNFLRIYPGIQEELGLNTSELDTLALADSGEIKFSDVERELGPARYEMYLDRKSSRQKDVLIDPLRANFASADLPLSESQASQLVPVLTSELRRQFSEDNDRVVPKDPRAVLGYRDETLARQEATYRRVVEAAGLFLTPEQLAILRSTLLGRVAAVRAELSSQGRNSVNTP
jgi:hypothetical protein